MNFKKVIKYLAVALAFFLVVSIMGFVFSLFVYFVNMFDNQENSPMKKYDINEVINDIEIEVYDFDPNVPCELYKSLENIVAMKNISMSYLEEVSSIKARYWIKIFDAVNNPTINSLNNLCNYYIEGKRIIGKTNI